MTLPLPDFYGNYPFDYLVGTEEEREEGEQIMFTVKLQRGRDMKLVQAEEVNIYPAGSAEGSDQDPGKRTTAVLSMETRLGSKADCFWIADTKSGPDTRDGKRPEGFAEYVIFYDCAYIENEHGATTEIVRPY